MSKILNISLEDYHRGEGISKSDLDCIHKSIAHYLDRKVRPSEPTPAMRLGSAIHCAILEPEEFAKRYTVLAVDGRTKEGKALKAEAEAGGLTILNNSDMEVVEGVVKSFKDHPTASQVLSVGRAEISYYWDHEGILLKSRPDWVREDVVVVDIKSTKDARPKEFARSCANFRYNVQQAMIEDGLRECGLEVQGFIFLAVETSPPYNVALYQLDEEAVRLGRLAYQEDLRKWDAYQRDPHRWAGYPYEIQTLSLPKWASEAIYD